MQCGSEASPEVAKLRPYPQHLRHLSRHYRESLVNLDYHPDIHLTPTVFG